MSSFDIVCVVDIQEVNNAVDQARREINNRYDFRNSNCTIDFDKNKPALIITADDELKMQTTIDIILTKLVKREVPVKSLYLQLYEVVEYTSNGAAYFNVSATDATESRVVSSEFNPVTLTTP